jgi:TonB-linked SusC/RagA family outer membrane protein
MKTIYKKLLFLFLLLPFSVLAQSTLGGVVLDKTTGQPIPGVNVNVQGTPGGTSTDFDGKFQLSNVKKGGKIIVSYIGYKTYTTIYDAQKTLNVALEEDSNVLQEVVVQVGYGSTKKKDVTGAVTRVGADNLNQGALVDPIQGLQGKAAGVAITKQGGDPNKGFDVRIRGAAGFAAGGSPLYVVDGVRGVDPTTVSPDDIVSYDILKDAASTAVYGADGANGVVFITTKKGKNGRTTIEINSYLATDQVARKQNFISADEYRNFMAANPSIDFTDNGGNSDWQDEIYGTGFTKSNSFAISGGSETSNYRGSVSNSNFEGVIKNSGKERTVGRLNLSQKAFDDKLTIDMGLSATKENNNYRNYGENGKDQVLYQAFQRLPTDPVYNADGSLFETGGTLNYFNPLHSINKIENTRDAKFLAANLGLDFELAKGLNAKVVTSFLQNDSESTYFEPTYNYVFTGTAESPIYNGYGKRSYSNWEQGLIEATLTYKKSFADSHNLTLLGGYSYRTTKSDGFNMEANNPTSNTLGSDNFENFETIVLGNLKSYKNERKDIGLFARAMYDFQSKYYVTAMIRRDGSSIFGDNEQWGYFPSVQVAWNIANENFIRDNVSALNLLKFRGSWGVSGNSNLPVDAKDLTVRPSVGPTGVIYNYGHNANPDLKWDQNTEINLGVDFGLFNNRVSGSVELYSKKITDMLIQNTNVPKETNLSENIFINGGEMKNAGIEATLNVKVIDNSNFSWNTTVVYTQNKQDVLALGNDRYKYDFIKTGYISGPGLVGVPTQRMQAGYRLGTFYGYEYAGVANGRWLINGNDSKLHFLDEQNGSEDHQKVIGNALPDFEMGWSNYLKYKNWDLSMSFRAVVGNDVYNATNQVFGNPDQIGTRSVNNEALILKDAGINHGAYNALSYYLEDASFIKLDNINLGYNFVNPSFSKFITKLRLYASMNNVFTLTNYGGADPEVNFSGGKDNKEIFFGIDNYNIYPKTRTLTFGVNIAF